MKKKLRSSLIIILKLNKTMIISLNKKIKAKDVVRDLRTGFTSPPKLTLSSLFSFATKPMWGINYLIKGKFSQIENINEVELLYVEDKTQINIKTETLDMYALSANYDKKINIIELFDNVKIIRDNESILGDYAKINTLTESYKVTSKESGKVKALLDKKDE